MMLARSSLLGVRGRWLAGCGGSERAAPRALSRAQPRGARPHDVLVALARGDGQDFVQVAPDVDEPNPEARPVLEGLDHPLVLPAQPSPSQLD
jgi:hypothetical protein